MVPATWWVTRIRNRSRSSGRAGPVIDYLAAILFARRSSDNRSFCSLSSSSILDFAAPLNQAVVSFFLFAK